MLVAECRFMFIGILLCLSQFSICLFFEKYRCFKKLHTKNHFNNSLVGLTYSRVGLRLMLHSTMLFSTGLSIELLHKLLAT